MAREYYRAPPPASEEVAQGQLHIARAVVLAGDFAEPRLQAPAGDAGVDHRDVGRHGELDAVEQVEHLGAELYVMALAEEANVLDHGEVEIILAVSPERVPAQV